MAAASPGRPLCSCLLAIVVVSRDFGSIRLTRLVLAYDSLRIMDVEALITRVYMDEVMFLRYVGLDWAPLRRSLVELHPLVFTCTVGAVQVRRLHLPLLAHMNAPGARIRALDHQVWLCQLLVGKPFLCCVK